MLNRNITPVLNRAEFRNSEWEFCLGWAVERAEFRPKTGSSRSSLGIPLSEFSSDEACCSAAITAQMGFFLSHLVVCVHTSSFSFAVVVTCGTTPNRRVIPSNTLAYQRSVSYASFCENCMLLCAVSHAKASARQQHNAVLDEVGT